MLGGVRSWSPPGPVKGNVLHILIVAGGQQACHTDEDRTLTYIILRYTLTNIYQHRNDILRHKQHILFHLNNVHL